MDQISPAAKASLQSAVNSIQTTMVRIKATNKMRAQYINLSEQRLPEKLRPYFRKLAQKLPPLKFRERPRTTLYKLLNGCAVDYIQNPLDYGFSVLRNRVYNNLRSMADQTQEGSLFNDEGRNL